MAWIMPFTRDPADNLSRLSYRIRLRYPDGHRAAYYAEINQTIHEAVRHIRCSRPDAEILDAHLVYERIGRKSRPVIMAKMVVPKVRGLAEV
jgi:hypothetical protein